MGLAIFPRRSPNRARRQGQVCVLNAAAGGPAADLVQDGAAAGLLAPSRGAARPRRAKSGAICSKYAAYLAVTWRAIRLPRCGWISSSAWTAAKAPARSKRSRCRLQLIGRRAILGVVDAHRIGLHSGRRQIERFGLGLRLAGGHRKTPNGPLAPAHALTTTARPARRSHPCLPRRQRRAPASLSSPGGPKNAACVGAGHAPRRCDRRDHRHGLCRQHHPGCAASSAP